jgi:hypothetical protein
MVSFARTAAAPARSRNWKASRIALAFTSAATAASKFTVTVGTVFERSKVPLSKWLLATHLMASSKKGCSAHQLHRSIGVTYKTAWFMFHRIREAMRNDDPVNFSSGGGVVESDETFIGHDKSKKLKGQKKGRGYHHKYKVLSLVDRDTKKVRSIVVDDLKAETLGPIIRENAPRKPVS